MTFGEKIKDARKAKGWTQKELADKIGALHNSVSGWENGKNKPDPDTIQLLCGVLEISVAYLMDGDEESFSPSEKLLMKKYRLLDDTGRDFVDYVLNREIERIEKESRKENVIDFSAVEENRIINYFGRLASAGTGQVIFDMPPDDKMEIPDVPKYKKVDYAIGVNGDSMEPKFSDGDILLVEVTSVIDVGEIGIFNVNGECFVKKRGKTELISLNPERKNIPLNEESRCMGRVIDKYEEIS